MVDVFNFGDDLFDDANLRVRASIPEGNKYFCSGETYAPQTRYKCVAGQPSVLDTLRLGYRRFEDGNRQTCKRNCNAPNNIAPPLDMRQIDRNRDTVAAAAAVDEEAEFDPNAELYDFLNNIAVPSNNNATESNNNNAATPSTPAATPSTPAATPVATPASAGSSNTPDNNAGKRRKRSKRGKRQSKNRRNRRKSHGKK